MKLIKILAIVTCASLLLSAKRDKPGENLVENGDFSSSRLKDWRMGTDAEHKVRKKTLQLKGLKSRNAHYASISQFIEIEKDKKYQVSFEVMGSEGGSGKIHYSIGRPSYAQTKQGVEYQHTKGVHTPTTEWTEVKQEFTGLYNTNNDEVMKKKVDMKELAKEWREKEREVQASEAPTLFAIAIGNMAGEFHIKNVVVKEMVDPAE